MSYSCPKCSSPFDAGTRYCQTCGCNLEAEFIEKPVCPVCKTHYPSGTKFCTNDGAVLVREEDLIPRCTRCGTAYSEEVKFCPLDGGEIKMKWSKPGSETQHSTTASSQAGASGPAKDILLDLPSTYPKGSLGNRFLASILYGLITGGLAIPGILLIVFGAGDEGNIPAIVFGIMLLIAPIVYACIKDGLGTGQSWGKKACNLMVVNLGTHQPCDKGTSFFRNFISGLVGAIPFVGGFIEPIMVLATEDGRKLGDRAANTQVINIGDYRFEQMDQY